MIRLRANHLLMVTANQREHVLAGLHGSLQPLVEGGLVLWLDPIGCRNYLCCGVVLKGPRLHQRRSARLCRSWLLRCGQGAERPKRRTSLHTRALLPVYLLGRLVRRRLRHLALLLEGLQRRVLPVCWRLVGHGYRSFEERCGQQNADTLQNYLVEAGTAPSDFGPRRDAART